MEKFHIENVVYSSVYHLESYQNDWTSKILHYIIRSLSFRFSAKRSGSENAVKSKRERERNRQKEMTCTDENDANQINIREHNANVVDIYIEWLYVYLGSFFNHPHICQIQALSDLGTNVFH